MTHRVIDVCWKWVCFRDLVLVTLAVPRPTIERVYCYMCRGRMQPFLAVDEKGQPVQVDWLNSEADRISRQLQATFGSSVVAETTARSAQSTILAASGRALVQACRQVEAEDATPTPPTNHPGSERSVRELRRDYARVGATYPCSDQALGYSAKTCIELCPNSKDTWCRNCLERGK